MSYFAHESAIIDEGCQIGKGTKIWHFSHLMPQSVIGENCNIGQNVFIASNVHIGNNNKIQNNVSLYDGVITHDDVFIGPSAVFTNVINPRSAVSRKEAYKKTTIKTGASIGANATIICGNDIGRFAFIGAGAVVTKDVPDFALMIGNPAIQKGWISKHGDTLNFDSKGHAICKATRDRYFLKGNQCELMP